MDNPVLFHIGSINIFRLQCCIVRHIVMKCETNNVVFHEHTEICHLQKLTNIKGI